jgi:hypothetical protein
MSSLVGDLWPADLVRPIPTSPIAIMNEQAILLGGKTGGLVLGDIRPEMEGRAVTLIFELVMPLLENYRYKIMGVVYPADQVYPLDIYVMDDPKIRSEDSTSFIQNLRTILNSDRIKNVIRAFVDMQSPQPPELKTVG